MTDRPKYASPESVRAHCRYCGVERSVRVISKDDQLKMRIIHCEHCLKKSEQFWKGIGWV